MEFNITEKEQKDMYNWIETPNITAIKLLIIPINTTKTENIKAIEDYKKIITQNKTMIKKEIKLHLKTETPLYEKNTNEEDYTIEKLTIKTLWQYEYKNIYKTQIWIPIIIYDENNTKWYTKIK